MKRRDILKIVWGVVCLFVIVSMVFSAFAFGF